MATHPASTLLRSALRPERRALAQLTGVLLASSVLPLAGPPLLGAFVDAALTGRPVRFLVVLGGSYLALAAMVELLQLVLTRGAVRLAWRAGNRLRVRLLRHVLGLDLGWHGDRTPGLLIERVDGDVDALAAFFQGIAVQVVGNLVVLVGVLGIATAFDWRLGLALLALALVAGGVVAPVRTIGVRAGERRREAAARLYGDLEERLAGVEDLRANGAGAYAVHRLHENEHHVWDTSRRSALPNTATYSVTSAVFALGTVLTLALAVALHDRGALSPGEVFVLYRYTLLVRHPVERIAQQLKDLQAALAGANRAAAILATEPALAVDAGGAELPPGPLSLRFEGVGFAYRDASGDEVVLHDLDLTVPAGRSLGVVGRTGSGKTTLARLALRLWDPTDGRVLIGGLDARQVAAAGLRRRVAVVTQEVQLFHASVRDNLTLFGALGAEVGDERLFAVLEEVGLGPWVRSRPGGLDAVVAGSGGLSAGEAQLLAFARAFLTDPGLVVLDEAGSRLDPATEAAVAAATERLLVGRTAIVIAHRLATLERVDDVLVLEHGRVVEHGPRAVLAGDATTRWAGLVALADAAADAEGEAA